MIDKRKSLIERYPHMKELVDRANDSIIDIAYEVSEMSIYNKDVVLNMVSSDLLEVVGEKVALNG